MSLDTVLPFQPVMRPFLSANTQAGHHEKKLYGGEELFAMGDIGRTELVKGRIIYLMPTGHPHGYYEGNFTIALGIFVRKHKLGRVLSGEVGVYTSRNPDTVRGADVLFISYERLAQAKSKGFLDVAPELIVEVKSPDENWPGIKEKLAEYFGIGVSLVWIADPRYQRVHVYRSLNEVEILTRDDELTGGDVLPGFGVLVAELFE